MWKEKKNCFIWSECNANAWLGQLLDNKFSFLSILLLKALFPTLTFGKTNLLENFITSLDSLFSPLPSNDTLKVSGDFLLSFHPEWETTSFAWSLDAVSNISPSRWERETFPLSIVVFMNPFFPLTTAKQFYIDTFFSSVSSSQTFTNRIPTFSEIT